MQVSRSDRFAAWLSLALLISLPVSRTCADLFVSSQTDPTAHSVLRYDGGTGAFVGVFASGGGLNAPLGMAFGPDGHLYVATGNSSQVLKYNGVTGAFLGVFASGGGLQAPINLTFGPDGNLYVSSSCCQVLRFNGSSGAFLGDFISGAGLDQPRGLAFGPDANLYVVNYNTGSVRRYNGTTGAFIDEFVPAGSGGLATPSDLAFGPDGNLYVTGGNFPIPGVFRYSSATGAFMNQFATVADGPYPISMAFGPDGNLYVVTSGSKFAVFRFDWKTGAFMDEFVASGSGGLSNPFGMAFSPGNSPELSCSAPTTVECGTPAEVTTVISDAGGRAMTVTWTVNGNVVKTNAVPATSPPAPVKASFVAELPTGTNVIGAVVASSPTNTVFCSTTVTVVETTPPTIGSAFASPAVLWPPTGRLVDVRIRVQASDHCGPVTCKIKSVKSNERSRRHGRGDRFPDWIITGGLTLKLRAELSGGRENRTYTITVECKNVAGNTATRDVTVTVPRDRGRYRADDDQGTKW
jgi:sugar lactone lactonase YvrE